MEEDTLPSEQKSTVLSEIQSSATNGEDAYNGQEKDLAESRRICSSTDSGRSSISSIQINQSDESVKKCLTTDIEELLSTNCSDKVNDISKDIRSTDIIDDLDIYADVTLVPQTPNVIILQTKDSKFNIKRSSRTKGCKSTKLRKHQIISKMSDYTEEKCKDNSSYIDAAQHIATDFNIIMDKSTTNATTFNSLEITTPQNTFVDDDSSNIITAKHCTNEIVCVTANNNSLENALEICSESKRNPRKSSLQNLHFNHIDYIDSLNSESKITNKTIEQQRSSTEESLNTTCCHELSSLSETINSKLKIDLLIEQDPTCTPKAIILPERNNSSSEHNVSKVSKMSESLNFMAKSDTQNVDVNTNVELKICTYTSSSSPIPKCDLKFTESPTTKKQCERASGSPIFNNNPSTGKLNLSQQSKCKSMPVHPLLSMQLPNNNQAFGSNTFRKHWSDRAKRNVQNSALLPNPLFQSANCFCAPQTDTTSLLINQPLYWWLPSLQLTHCSQPKSQSASPFQLTQIDASTLNAANVQPTKIQMATPYDLIEGPNSNFINTTLCNHLAGIQLMGNPMTMNEKYNNERSQYIQQKMLNFSTNASTKPIDTNNSFDVSTSLKTIASKELNLEQSTTYSRNLEGKTNSFNGLTDIERDVGELRTSGCAKNISQSRSMLSSADNVTHKTSSSVATIANNAETDYLLRSFGSDLNLQESGNNQVAQNMVAYNAIVDPNAIPTNFVYMYNTAGQLFAIPSTAMIYPTPTQQSSNELISGTDSAYSSPPTIFPAQVIHEAGYQPGFATNFDVSLGLLGTGQETELRNGANFNPISGTICSADLAFSRPGASSYHIEPNQWSNFSLSSESEQKCALNQTSETSTRFLYCSPNTNQPTQNSQEVTGQNALRNNGADSIHASITNTSDRQVRDRLNKPNGRLTRLSHGPLAKLTEVSKTTRGSLDSSTGLLGNVKSTSSILGDSKLMILQPMSNFKEEIGTCATVQNSHARQKKNSSKTNLYIRGLPSTFTEEHLHALAPDKELIRSVKLIGGSEGEMYGFIDFANNVAARAALHHIKSTNRELYVNFAYESEKDPQNVYITNIPETWTASNVEDLKRIFQPYGQIATAIVMTKRSNNFCTGAGFVRFVRSEDAQKAIEGIRIAQIKLDGSKGPLEVKLADRQKPTDDQSSVSKSRISKQPIDEKHANSSAGQNDTSFDLSRKSMNQCANRGNGCVLSGDQVLPLLDITINSNNSDQRLTCNLPNGPGLLPSAVNQIGLNSLSNPNVFAVALQSAMRNSSFVHPSLLLQHSLNGMNFSIPTANETQTIAQPNVLSYRAPGPQFDSFVSQQQGTRINTGLVQNQQFLSPVVFPGQSSLIPLIRGPLEELRYDSSAIDFAGTHQQTPLLGHAIQPNGKWTSSLIPRMFASI